MLTIVYSCLPIATTDDRVIRMIGVLNCVLLVIAAIYKYCNPNLYG